MNDELDAIDNQFNGNRDQVIDTLLQAVMNVELEVPRVVKQNFVIAAEEWEWSRVSQKRKSAEVDVPDIRKVYSLFVDIKRSTQFLKEFEQEFMFSEAPKRQEDAEMEQMDWVWSLVYDNKDDNIKL